MIDARVPSRRSGGPASRLRRLAGGRNVSAAGQLVLICLWHWFLPKAGAVLLDALWEAAQYFWYRRGLGTIATNVWVAPRPSLFSREGLHEAAGSLLVPILLEALAGWLVFRLVLRRPRPRWYRFVRYWWQACLYGTAYLGAIEILRTCLSGTGLFGTGYFLFIWGAWFCVVPTALALRNVVRRSVRIAPLCPLCRYWLRVPGAATCSECGAPLVRASAGGYAIDRARNVPREDNLFRKERWRRRRRRVLLAGLFLAPVMAPASTVVALGLVFPPTAMLFHTQRGPAEYTLCGICGAVRLKYADGTVQYASQSRAFGTCKHAWNGKFTAWSRRRLSAGDVLLIRSADTYSAVKVLRNPGATIRFEWFHQPDKSKSTFNDPGVTHGVIDANRITFGNVDIPYQNGSVWYDFYFGGIDGATPNAPNPHHIAFAGKVDVATIDASDPRSALHDLG